MVDITKTYLEACDTAYNTWKTYTTAYLNYWDRK